MYTKWWPSSRTGDSPPGGFGDAGLGRDARLRGLVGTARRWTRRLRPFVVVRERDQSVPAPIESRASVRIAPTISALLCSARSWLLPGIRGHHTAGGGGARPVVLAIETPGPVGLRAADVELRAVGEGETEGATAAPRPVLPARSGRARRAPPPRPRRSHGGVSSARAHRRRSGYRAPAPVRTSGRSPGTHSRNTTPTIARDPSTPSRGIIGIATPRRRPSQGCRRRRRR